ncbi:MAG: alpha/beta hydrolase [Tsuneonella suprasediminis]|uniref:Esterase n=1 Tax=Tsuneonella suprasediminis TaxID=2306996 RepID=A0A419R374_9SPHN|nr:alpha/beta hydrolase-fold protein [Tsuneonella suprasediminis]RJX68727.1 hypothetical protein D6858_05540 [Tsuneonella suprasediminis]
MTFRRLFAAAFALLVAACATVPKLPLAGPELIEWGPLAAADLPDQRVTIWLPPEYSKRPAARFPVLYMWDGQNLFTPARTQYGKAWMVHQVLDGVVADRSAEPHIVVGVHSPPGADRYRVYLPQKVADRTSGKVRAAFESQAGGPFAADRQLAWVADVLKPRIDMTYRTRPDADETTVVGASMGGLMACYAAIERPEVFGRAGCVSVPFAPLDPALADANGDAIASAWSTYLGEHLGSPDGRRIWMDHGMVGMDAAFGPWQDKVAGDFAAAGWRDGADYTARAFPGAEHDENFWRARLPEILRWLWRPDER